MAEYITFRVAGAPSAGDAARLEKAACAVEGVRAAYLDTLQRTLSVLPASGGMDETVLMERLQAAIRPKAPGIILMRADSPSTGDALRMELALMTLGGGLLLISTQLGQMTQDALMVSLLVMLSYAVIGYTTLRDTIVRLLSLRPVDDGVAVTLATIALIPMGFPVQAALIMLIYHAITLLGAFLRSRTLAGEMALEDILPRETKLWDGRDWMVCKTRDILPGDMLLVERAGVLPADGILADPDAQVCAPHLLGLKEGVRLSYGAALLAGFENCGDTDIRIEATRAPDASAAARIKEAYARARIGRTASDTRLARVIAPLNGVLMIAGVAAAITLWLLGMDAAGASRFIAISICLLPSALALSWQIAALQGIRALLRRGIAPRDAAALGALAQAKAITLPGFIASGEGALSIAHVEPAGEFTRTQIINAASVAGADAHDAAFDAIHAAAYPAARADQADYMQDSGVLCVCEGVAIAAGSAELLKRTGIDAPDIDGVHVSIDGVYAGLIMFEESAGHADVADALSTRCGVTLSGDDAQDALSACQPGLLDDTRCDADITLLMGVSALPDAVSIARSVKSARVFGMVITAIAGVLSCAAAVAGFIPLYAVPMCAALATAASMLRAYAVWAWSPMAAIEGRNTGDAVDAEDAGTNL